MYPPTPRWWAVAFGLWAATLALVIWVLDGAVQALTELVLVLGLGLMMAWDRRRRGTSPTGALLATFIGPSSGLALGAVAVAGTSWFVGEQLSVGAAAAIADVGTYAVVSWYQHDYAAIAARNRDGLK